jgi:hypothetical protein
VNTPFYEARAWQIATQILRRAPAKLTLLESDFADGFSFLSRPSPVRKAFLGCPPTGRHHRSRTASISCLPSRPHLLETGEERGEPGVEDDLRAAALPLPLGERSGEGRQARP